MSVDGWRAYTAEEVVSSEGVAVEVPVAPVFSRIGAGLIDLVITGLLALAAVLVTLRLGVELSEPVQRILSILLTVSLFVLWPALWETLTLGRTPGKWVLGLRAVRDDGGPIGFRQALVRALIGFVEKYATGGTPAVLSSFLNRQGKRLGDMAAGTVVVSQRLRPVHPTPNRMPPDLDRWARSADLAPLPAGLAVAVRQFLGRAAGLQPAARATVGADLLRAVLPHVAPPPPPAHPESILAAVLAERRVRDAARLDREAAGRARVLPPDPLA